MTSTSNGCTKYFLHKDLNVKIYMKISQKLKIKNQTNQNLVYKLKKSLYDTM